MTLSRTAGLVPVIVGHPHRPQHGAGRRPGRSVGHLVAAGLHSDQRLLRRIGLGLFAHLCMVRRQRGCPSGFRCGAPWAPANCRYGRPHACLLSPPFGPSQGRLRADLRLGPTAGPGGLLVIGRGSTTTTSATVPVADTRCELIPPAKIRTDLGTTVAAPSATVHGATTVCTYKSADLATRRSSGTTRTPPPNPSPPTGLFQVEGGQGREDRGARGRGVLRRGHVGGEDRPYWLWPATATRTCW